MKQAVYAITVLLIATSMTAPVVAGGILTTDVTLRVAPEGFVVPSHWKTKHKAEWLVDPVNTTSFNGETGVAGCQLTVSDANGDGAIDGGEALDKAVNVGCIIEWSYTTFDEGRFVTSVDGVNQTQWPIGWWMIQTDKVWSSSGIDDMNLTHNQSLGFVYYNGIGFDPRDL